VYCRDEAFESAYSWSAKSGGRRESHNVLMKHGAPLTFLTDVLLRLLLILLQFIIFHGEGFLRNWSEKWSEELTYRVIEQCFSLPALEASGRT
jgi:hypothetical protein